MTDPNLAALPPDAPARARALDPARSFLVQAPAGSGKTTLLTQRFLALLARTEHPESVLAITFTRKATGEMRSKIVEALARAAAQAPARDAAEAINLELARRVLEVDAARNWQLLGQPTRLRIQTIDSLNHWLAGRLPILSRAGATLSVSTDPEELYARAARRTIAELEAGGELAEELSIVLEHLDNEVDRLEPLLASMLASRERWLRHVLPAAGGGVDATVRAGLEDALRSLVGSSLALAAARLPAELARRLWPLAAAAAGRHPGPTDGLRSLGAAGAAGLPPTAAALGAWQALAGLLLTQDGTFRKTVNKNQGFPPEAKADKAAMLALLRELALDPALAPALESIRVLPPAGYDEVQWRVLRALHGVLVAAALRLAEAFAAAGTVDFAAVQGAALQALGTPDAPTDLTLELDYRLQHILVDEFQDTSAPQVGLLERLTAGWQTGDGRTLFLVGDPMQSIYAFREADVGRFLLARRHGIGGIPLETLTLTANFRSRPAVVEWVNEAFRQVLPVHEDLARGAVPYSASAAVRAAAPDTGIRLTLLEGASAAEEAEAIADLVAMERARNPAASIAVLGQSRRPLTAVARALRARRIAFQGVALEPLAERPAVRDLVALARALAHRADRIAWLACLRAPWCGLGLESLLELVGDDPAATLWERISDDGRLARLAASERARLEATRTVLGRALADRARRPLAECVEAAWLALGGPATLREAADLENAASFLSELDRLEHAGDLEDPPALAAKLTELYAAPDADADESLQLLTVHRAKGLEWDVVVLAGLGRRPRGAGDRLLHWLEFTREDGAPGLVLAPRRAGALPDDPLESWLKGLERARSELELGRLLYVAATRARERLHLVGHVRARDAATGAGGLPDRGSLLAKLWPVVGPGAELTPVRAAAAPREAAARAERLPALWQAPPVPPGIVTLRDPPRPEGPTEFEFEWVGAAARHVGTVVHEELERAGTRSLEALARTLATRRPLWRRRLLELGIAEEELARALERIARALEFTLGDTRGRWLFDPTHTDVASELDLSTLRAGQVVTRRIDRSFVDARGVRWIVDFKTSVHEGTDVEAFLDRERERYASQLAGYADLLRQLDPGRPIRLGLYFPLLAGWREWAAPAGAPAA